jgi:hypothetical protein
MTTCLQQFIEHLEERLNFSTLTVTAVGIRDGTSNTVTIDTRKPAQGLQKAQGHTPGVIAWNPD